MISSHVGRPLGAPRVIVAALAALLVSLAFATSALATPTGEYEVFKDCPLATTGVVTCIYSTTTGGEVKIGSTAVPIAHPIVLQGGLKQNGFETPFVNAADGNTLSKVEQTVPGGLLGLVAPHEWPGLLQFLFNEAINHGPTGATATTELVGPVQYNFFSLLVEEGPGVVLPVRIKLNNPFLGSGCYIGSSSSPITLGLTDGTTNPPAPNTPITGSLGELEQRNAGNLLLSTGNKLVDNAFSVPTANGCGPWPFEFFVDLAVDLKLGLPSAAGKNTAILTGNLEQAAASAVKASE